MKRMRSLLLWLVVSIGYLVVPTDIMPGFLIDDAVIAAIATFFELKHQVKLCTTSS